MTLRMETTPHPIGASDLLSVVKQLQTAFNDREISLYAWHSKSDMTTGTGLQVEINLTKGSAPKGVELVFSTGFVATFYPGDLPTIHWVGASNVLLTNGKSQSANKPVTSLRLDFLG